MPRSKRYNEEEALEKAMELFWKKGYHATSIQDLVDHLGINRASLYSSFGGKQQLFNQSFEFYRSGKAEQIRKLLKRDKNVKSGFRNLFQWAVESSAIDPDNKGCFVVNTTTELTPGESEVLEALKDYKRQIEQVFLDYLQYGVKKGQLSKKKNWKIIARALFTYYNGLRVVAKLQVKQKRNLESVEALLMLLD